MLKTNKQTTWLTGNLHTGGRADSPVGGIHLLYYLLNYYIHHSLLLKPTKTQVLEAQGSVSFSDVFQMPEQ